MERNSFFFFQDRRIKEKRKTGKVELTQDFQMSTKFQKLFQEWTLSSEEAEDASAFTPLGPRSSHVSPEMEPNALALR